MKILEQIAQDIVDKTSEILQHPISITDDDGYIIGATDKRRIGLFHPPSLEVIQRNMSIDCDNEINQQILPGISVPINFNNKVIGVLGIVGNPREVEKYGQLVKNQVEMMCQEAFRKEMVEMKEKMVELFVHQLIHHEELESNELLLKYSSLLDIDLHTDRVCLLIDMVNLSKKISVANAHSKSNEDFSVQYFQRDVMNYLNLIFHEDDSDIISTLNIERFIIIKTLPFQQSYANFTAGLEEKLERLNQFLQRKYEISAIISVGGISHGINGVPESYDNAKKAMNIGVQHEIETGIHIYNEREMILHFLPRELTADYREKLMNIIAPLTDHENYEVLASTFVAYCKYDLNLSEASRNMFTHRNTIIYRLERIKEITSLNTNNFKHCMLLYTAIQCYEETIMKNTFFPALQEQSPVSQSR